MTNSKPEIALRKNLKKLIEIERITISELARKTGIAKQVLSDWLAGTHPRNLSQVKIVAEYFHISIDDLCFEPIANKKSRIVGMFSGQIGEDSFVVRICRSES